jgi:DNA-binding CsgD family transcriptional regulator/DNA-binding Lrp family transcriptional regulator
MEPLKRGAALDRVRELATAPHEGALLVQGEPGIGKSHLLDSVASVVDMTTVVLRISPAEHDFALSGISTILAGLRREGVTEFGGRFTLRSDDPDHLFAAAHDLIGLIRGFSLQPTLLLIDDIDQTDPQSRALIGIMASRLAGTGLRLVMTASAIPAHSPLGAIPTIRLSPLRIAELIALGESLAVDADLSTLRILVSYCGGNPRILVENLRLIDSEQLTGATWLMLPPRFNHALSAVAAPQLESLSKDQLDILGFASLAPLWHVGAIADAGFDTADRVEDLVNEGILKRQGPFVSFKDRRLRAYVHWSSDTHARRERHAALEQAHACHDEALASWHRSFTSYDKTGIDELLTGAARLIRADRLAAAIELSERALRKADRIEDHVPAVIELCEQLLSAGEVTLAARYSRRVRPDAVQPIHALRLASFDLVAQMFQYQRVADDEVRALVGLHAHADPDGAGRLLTLAACFRAERWEADEARGLLDDFPHVIDQVDPTAARLIASIRAGVDALEGVPATEPVTLDALADLNRYSPAELLMHGYLLTHLERYGDSRLLLTTVLNHPRSVDHIWTNLARYALITNEIGAGQFRRARAAIDAWSDDTPGFSHRSSLFSFVQAWRSSSLGRVEEATEHLEQSVELASLEGSPAARARALGLRGTLALVAGDPETAVVVLRQVSGFAGRFRNPTMLRHWADYVEACQATGRHREAEAVVSALERRLESHQSRWGAIALARSRAVVAPDDRAISAFTTAVTMIGPAESPYERARTLSAMADRQDLLGLPHEARRTRSMMMEAFDTAGIIGWPGQRRPTPDDEEENLLMLLSEEEIAIARQVQDGARNREIAESLYLSVRTVELRLTHIYRTLGVRSRSHLVAELAKLEASRHHPQRQTSVERR